MHWRITNLLDLIGGDRLVDFFMDTEHYLYRQPMCKVFGHKKVKIGDLTVPMCRRCYKPLEPTNVIDFGDKK